VATQTYQHIIAAIAALAELIDAVGAIVAPVVIALTEKRGGCRQPPAKAGKWRKKQQAKRSRHGLAAR